MDYFSDSYLKFEEDFYRYSALGEPLTTLTDDILRAMAMSQKNYFKLSKRHSKDGRDHYFYFTIEFSKTEVGVRKFEYNTHTCPFLFRKSYPKFFQKTNYKRI